MLPKMSGEEHRRIRKGLGMTQEEWAKLNGVVGPTVSDWERGKYPVPDATANLARLLKNCPSRIVELMPEKEIPARPICDREAIVLAERRSAREDKAGEDAKLWRFHQSVISDMRDPQQSGDIRRQALDKIALWEREGAASCDFINRWRLLLDMPLDDMASEVLSEERWGPALRQATPFGFMFREYSA